MSLTAAMPDTREPRSMPGWRYWLTNAVVVPIAASIGVFLLIADRPGGVSELGAVAAIGGVAAFVAALYVVAVWSHGFGAGRAVAGYALAAVLTVPWGYTLLIGAMVIACESGGTCPS